MRYINKEHWSSIINDCEKQNPYSKHNIEKIPRVYDEESLKKFNKTIEPFKGKVLEFSSKDYELMKRRIYRLKLKSKGALINSLRDLGLEVKYVENGIYIGE